MQITGNGLKKPEIQEINIKSFGDNVDILDEHLSNTDIHVNAGKIAEITESDELSQINSTDTNSTMWGKIKKSISVLDDHVDAVASETTLGHIKIGTGLKMTDDVASVKIANDLTTDDSDTVLSAAMGKSLKDNKAPNNHASTSTTYGTGNASNYGHVKLSDNYTTSAGAESTGVGASSKAVADAYNAINTKFNNKLKWEKIAFKKSDTYINNEDTWAWKMGQVCICELRFDTKQQINANSKVKIGTVSLPSMMSTFCIGQIQSTTHTCVFSIGNVNISSDQGYDIYLETLNNTIAAGEWLRGNLIYFVY